jgi:sulfotransferase family protein
MTLPNFFVIGAAKAGTTSLHHYLGQHHEIQMSAVKEPRFFAGPENGIPYPPDRVSRLDHYERLFDPAFKIRGEASTDYSVHPRRPGVPERIHRLVPEARFLYLVRDPIARSISHFRMRAALLGERRSLSEALGDLSDDRSPYIAPSLYATQLELYLRHFPEERILVIDQAEMLSDRGSTMRQVFRFLGADDAVEIPGLGEELLVSRDWRTYPPAYLRFVEGVLAPAGRCLPPRIRRRFRRWVEHLLWPPLPEPSLDAALAGKLKALFGNEADRLRSLTGKEFATWSV